MLAIIVQVQALKSLRLAAVLGIAGALLGCQKGLEHFTLPPYAGPFKLTVDYSPVWSHDGRLIAYRRAFTSTDGPPGAYIVPSTGGRPRLVALGSALWPASMRFSPDDKSLLGVSNSQLVVIDIASGAANTPTYTDNHAQAPDWSPDGRQIVYNRAFYMTGQPLDSAGIHVLDLSTGQDRPLSSNGQVVGGTSARWSRDGSWIAFIDFSTPQAIRIIQPDGSGLRTLVTASSGSDFRALTWFRPPGTGSDGLLYLEPNGRISFIDLTSPSPTRYQLLYGYDDFSPDGTRYTLVGTQPTDSSGVVFTAQVNDFTGESLRQITVYTPPPLTQEARESRSLAKSWIP